MRGMTTMRVWVFALACSTAALSQDGTVQRPAEVTAHIVSASDAASSGQHHSSSPPAVLWLQPLDPGTMAEMDVPRHSGYTLLQKNKMFSPHLLVVPAGSVVSFPNADPFFHNVFSLFDGRRFDLGLYEAGTTKQVRFGREGVSYIFCNIHPEMSAVVVALSTPLWSIADANGSFHLHHVPAGEYQVHLWVEGEDQRTLDRWVHRVRIVSGVDDLGAIPIAPQRHAETHANKFGQPYSPDSDPY